MKLLVGHGADVRLKGFHTPLFAACSYGKPDVIEFLLGQGVEPDGSAFVKAIWSGNAKSVKLLIDAGADVHGTSGDGETPAHSAAGLPSPDVLALLIDAGAKVNAATTNTGETPLHIAAKRGRLESIRVLVKAGAKVDALNRKKQTPQQWARGYGELEAATLLKALKKS